MLSDSDITSDDDKLGEIVNGIENQVKAKKAILEEVLRTVENDKDKAKSLKRRKYIRDILHCEVSHETTENNLLSAKFIDCFRFEGHVIIRFDILNRLGNGNLSIRVSTCSSGCSIRWILFENLSSVNICSVSRSSEVLYVAVPFVAFFQNGTISLNIHFKLERTEHQVLHPTMHSVIETNLTPEVIPEAFVSESVHISNAIEELELKSIEFLNEQKSVRIIQSIFTVYCCSDLQKSPDFSGFRRIFPEFLANDFDTWRLFVGTDRFDGILIYTQTDGDTTKSYVIGKSASICRNFIGIINEKMFKN